MRRPRSVIPKKNQRFPKFAFQPTFPRWILVGRCCTLPMTNVQSLDRSIKDFRAPASTPSRLGTSNLLPTRSAAQTFLSGIPDKSPRQVTPTSHPDKSPTSHIEQRLPRPNAAANHVSHGGADAQPLGVVDIFITCQSAVDRLTEQRYKAMLLVLAQATILQVVCTRLGQCQRLVEFSVREQPGVGGERGSSGKSGIKRICSSDTRAHPIQVSRSRGGNHRSIGDFHRVTEVLAARAACRRTGRPALRWGGRKSVPSPGTGLPASFFVC